ncbi:Phospholipid/glycerol acyltransferase [Trypanosoma melophagium]|uniref:Phospholipid/glycerol acyltransferase n=1 Tax=Trypanosoma melophagium TaxID=715481 RepID=UPI00351A28A6|nr:Phospholipid/glycerol acyltransferase [Trypanosoma melophagium]
MSRDDGASEVPRLPFRRIIVLSSDGMCWLGAACAISLAQSPMLRPDKQGCCTQIIIANHFNTSQMILSGDECLSRGVKSIPSLTALEALCGDITQGSAVLQRVGIAVDAAQSPNVAAPHFTADFTHDVFVYIAAWSDAVCDGHTSILSLAALTHSAVSQEELQHTPLTVPHSSRHRPYGRLILLVDDATRAAVCATATRALLLPRSANNSSSSNWRLFLAGAPQLAPPAGDFRLTRAVVRRGGAGRGVLEGVALGVALGVLRRLPAAFRDVLPAAPLDLAAHAALLALARQQRPKKGEKEGKPKREEEGIEIGIGGDLSVRPVAGEGTLVWGMFAEYLMDYYGRVGTTIAKEFPLPKLMDPQPTLQLNASVPDWINYGFSLMMPFKCYYEYCETQRRKQLLNYFTGSKTVKCLRTAIDNIDMAVHSVTKMVKSHALPNQYISSNNQSSQLPKSLAETGTGYYYNSLIQEIVGNESLRSLYSFISLNCVKWDIFVKVIAEGVIEQFAWQVSNHSLSLPPPLPQYHNDIVFHGTRRALPTNLCPRKFFTDMHWVVRCGMHPDGTRVSTEPGLTKKIQATILKQPEVLKAISETAKAEKSSITVVEKRSEGILRTIGDNLNQLQVRTFGLMVRRLLFQLYDEVTLNNEAFERLYSIFHTPRVHVMLLPAHRSYVDFIIITYLLVAMNFSPPHVCAGEDFLRMGPISKLMRGSGAFFIRRSFRGDKLYQTIFKEYVRQLVLHRQVIEFFIEGTRSRTGKMVSPKLGVLKFITDAFFERQNTQVIRR